MRINPAGIYQQKILEISNRINTNLQAMNSPYNFNIAFEQAKQNTNSVDGTGNVDSSLTEAGTVVTNSNMKSTQTDYDSIIKEKSQLYNVNENLIKAVIQAESSFNPNSVSGAGAIGLMQLMPSTAKSLNITNPYDPEQNIDGGVRYLKNQINNFGGDVKMALAAYNCGPTRLKNLNITNLDDSSQFSKLPKETQNYVNKIMKNLS